MKISIIVPSYQQARFLTETLESLVQQDGVDLEIIIQDGGSTDGSVEIIKKFAEQYPHLIQWESKPDGGQTNAINIGLQRAAGEILGYLNSDDILYPGALKRVHDFFQQNPAAKAVYARADHTDEKGEFIGEYPTEPWNYQRLLETCYICQPACFWRKSVVEEHGLFNAELNYSMDYEYWLRAGKNEPFYFLKEKLAASRCHGQAKRFDAELKVREEAARVAQQYAGGKMPFTWAVGVARCHAECELTKPRLGGLAKLFFCLTYWHSLFGLWPQTRGFCFSKFIPPLSSALNKRRDTFHHLRVPSAMS